MGLNKLPKVVKPNLTPGSLGAEAISLTTIL